MLGNRVMKKNLYRIVPKDKTSCSGRWVVDEFGLNYLKTHYTKYGTDSGEIDRWVEFKVKKMNRDTINFDFGGMIDAKEPEVVFRWRGQVCGIPITHLIILKEALSDNRCIRPSGGWCAKIWMWKWYIGDSTRKELLKIVNRLFSKNRDRIELYHGQFMKKMEDFRSKGIIE